MVFSCYDFQCLQTYLQRLYVESGRLIHVTVSSVPLTYLHQVHKDAHNSIRAQDIPSTQRVFTTI